MLPYFQKLENQEDDTNPTAGHNGPINIINPRDHQPNPLSETFIEAGRELGYPVSPDFNVSQTGVGWHHLDIRNGKRYAPARLPGARADPAERHLERRILHHPSAVRGNRAVGVEYIKDGQLLQARASSEVLLCASGLQTPKLLMLSGIGNPTQLAEFGIETRVGLPGVGENYHDHVLMVAPVNSTDKAAPDPNLNLSEVGLFANTGGWPVPDLQIGFVHRAQFQAEPNPRHFTAIPGLVRPLSRGTVRLASSNPTDNVRFDPQYLSHPSDLERMVKAFEISREMFATKAFAAWGSKEVLPGVAVSSKEEVTEYVKANVGSYYHYVGAAKMGTDNLSVVDPQLKVYGVEGLRIADAR